MKMGALIKWSSSFDLSFSEGLSISSRYPGEPDRKQLRGACSPRQIGARVALGELFLPTFSRQIHTSPSPRAAREPRSCSRNFRSGDPSTVAAGSVKRPSQPKVSQLSSGHRISQGGSINRRHLANLKVTAGRPNGCTGAADISISGVWAWELCARFL